MSLSASGVASGLRDIPASLSCEGGSVVEGTLVPAPAPLDGAFVPSPEDWEEELPMQYSNGWCWELISSSAMKRTSTIKELATPTKILLLGVMVLHPDRCTPEIIG